MACASCKGNSRSSNCSGCCDQKAMDVVTPLENIRNGDENFCFNEITDKICENLSNDEGIHPSATNSNTDCDDLSSLNDLATGSLNNSLIPLNMCDVEALKCWLFSLISWNWNMFKAIICAICGLWCRMHNVIDNIKILFSNDAILLENDQTLQEEITCLSNALSGLYSGNIETSFNVRSDDGSLPGGSQGGSFNKDGSFTLYNDEVVPTAGIRTTINGRVNYTSSITSNGISFNVMSVYIDKIVGTLVNGGYNDLMSTKVVVGNTTVFDSGGKNIPLDQPFTENIQQTFPLNETGTAPAGGDTGFMDIINLVQQNVLGGSDIDNVWGQIRFRNVNASNPPSCLQDLDGINSQKPMNC